MLNSLEDAVVVITGASSGVGQATAEAFAGRRSKLVLAARDAAALHEVARTCRELGAEVLVAPTDVTDADAVKDLARKAMSFGKIDVWFSNVGVGAVGRFEETPIEAHEQVIRTNLIGHLNDAHAAVPIFRKQGHGIFINMISLGGFASAPFAAAYSASKFGLRGFSEALRAELADERDIHICDVYPTFMDTPGVGHGANYTGRRLSVPPPVYNARRAARAIVRLAERPRNSLTVGLVADLTRFAHFVAPNMTPRLMAKLTSRYLSRAPRVARSHGNLFRAPAEPGGIDGGLRSSRRVPVATTAAVCVLGIAVAALVLGKSRAPVGRGRSSVARLFRRA
ncbi:SDR family oxidoreductase [Sinorhizobium meliloti]|uniref:Short chain dehydrogenase n=2 Tax=Rhizobium meliloti TaxID=382 RepID=F7XJ49_SINMM|nr:SDR family oxidoreductase [Sinorhizobium meliloti]PST28201.1 KR domain-containing protein [Mesorhizobium loti]AEH84351.1 short chain dehydrogenase [Sinorhizobium meliloti SM11]AIM03959.1 short-chain dehydrogenase [Sinorhizobium meliloti]ASP75769.1 short-chain dehydrogenase [Sinorhizobium meliloti]MBP2468626.1 short-subunit dehydrogenase [Sinorhizobium meliloti]